MRIGINPLVNSSVPPMPGIVAAVITHLPNRLGYHAQRFEVIQTCLLSLMQGAGRRLPLYIWDNGSDEQFRNWLTTTLRPDFLTLSPNIGKAGARSAILRSFPLDTIICLSDDDIYFETGWLDAQLELLYGFPNVGAVSGCPIRTQQRWGNKATIAWAKENATLQVGRFIPDQWEQDFCASIERTYSDHLQDSARDKDYLIDYHNMSAYAMAHHMQFVAMAGRLESLGVWPNQAMRAEQRFDVAMDNLGLLRLTTTKRYTRHLGNILETE